MGKFITIEGIEGSGKSTLIGSLREELEGRGYSVTTTREPGATVIGRKLRGILLDSEGPAPAALTEVLLFAADRAQHVAELIRPSLDAGSIVLCDRFTDSTLAYQGAGRGLPVGLLETLNSLATDGLRPDLVLVLDLDPESGLRRAADRSHTGDGAGSWTRFEAEESAFHTRIREAFLEVAARDPERYRVLDASLPPAELATLALRELDALLPAHGKQ